MGNGKLISTWRALAPLAFTAMIFTAPVHAEAPFADGNSLPRFETTMARVAHSALDSNRGKASSERRNDPRPAVTLDLRPPEFGKIAVDVAAAPARDTMGPQTRDAAALSKLSMERSMSSAEELRRRVHHEGMPVARLFESKSALVSVGLNQHGKPGLWLIQKTH